MVEKYCKPYSYVVTKTKPNWDNFIVFFQFFGCEEGMKRLFFFVLTRKIGKKWCNTNCLEGNAFCYRLFVFCVNFFYVYECLNIRYAKNK